MLTLVVTFLTLLSYDHLALTEARTRNEDTFTIDLMHRNSPISPFYNPTLSSLDRLQRLLEVSNSRLGLLKYLQNNVDTTILANEGDYLMSLYVGTPPVELVAVLDTSIDLTWFQCAPCMNCYKQSIPLFNPDSSKTYHTLPCDSPHCSSLDPSHIMCEQDSNQCLYWYTFGNQTSMTRGVMGNDTFSFVSSDGENNCFPLTAFGCGFDQGGLFDPRSAGVASFGNGPLSLVSQMGYKFDYKFSYCLASENSNSTSKLRFGPLIPSGTLRQGTIVIPFITKTPVSFYNLELNGITVGQTSIQVGNDIIMDTASTLTYLPPSIFLSLESMINGAIGMKPMSNALIESVLCYTTTSSGLVLTPPDIMFHFNGGDLVLKGVNVFFEYNGSLCLSIVATPEDGDPLVLGNMAQVNMEVEYDLLSKTVSFAQKDCAQDY